jgi:hypothetical protein
MAISSGKSSEEAINTLCSQVKSLEKELRDDDIALKWFNLYTTVDSTLDSTPSTPSPNLLKNMFQGDCSSLLTVLRSNSISVWQEG